MSRRSFLKAGGSGLTIAALQPGTSFADPLGIPIGLQLYTLNAELKKDFAGTLEKIAAIGIRDVELITYPDRRAAEVRKALKDAGLHAVAIHADSFGLAGNAQKQLDDAAELGVKYFVCAAPVMPPESGPKAGAPMQEVYAAFRKFVDAMTLDDWRWNAEFFNQLGAQSKKMGLQFGYHNHSMEFRRLDGVVAYDELLKQTDPKLVTMEMDCGWAESANADSVSYLQNYPGRFRLLHIKDIKHKPAAGEEETLTTEVGYGIINWQRIFSAAKQGGVQHYFIEQEPPFERPALDSVRMSYNWLRAMK